MQAYKKVLSSISLFLVSVSLLICSASHVCLCVLDSEVRKPMPGLQKECVPSLQEVNCYMQGAALLHTRSADGKGV
jgi:hypothetical protein